MPIFLSSVVLCLTVLDAFPQTVSKPNPRESAVTAVGEAIRLLDSKDYKTFLSQFVPPDQVKARGGTPEAMKAWIEMFSTRADTLLAALKYASTQTPTYDDAKTMATFPLKEELGGNPLRMMKIGQYWYVANK